MDWRRELDADERGVDKDGVPHPERDMKEDAADESEK